MPALSISDIQNDTVRKHMENCETSLDKDDFNEAVRSCADAYIYIYIIVTFIHTPAVAWISYPRNHAYIICYSRSLTRRHSPSVHRRSFESHHNRHQLD